jgi:hypothetical protein
MWTLRARNNIAWSVPSPKRFVEDYVPLRSKKNWRRRDAQALRVRGLASTQGPGTDVRSS